MTADLLDQFKRAFSADFVAQVANRLGESQQAMQAAIDAMLPVLLGCLAQRGTTADSAASLIKTVASVPTDPATLANPALLLSHDTGALERLTTMGPGLLGFLLGNKANGLAGAVSAVSGARTSSMSWLSAMLAPLVCALLNRIVQAEALDGARLSALLAEQVPALRDALDRRVVNALNVPNLSGYLPAESVNPVAVDTPAPPAATSSPRPPSASSNRRPLWIALAILALGALTYLLFA